MKIYNKLVRDRIPDILKHVDKQYSMHIADEKEYGEKLKEKLQEEVQEFLENPCLEELADITEVISTIVYNMGYTSQDLNECMTTKKGARGGFHERIILENVKE